MHWIAVIVLAVVGTVFLIIELRGLPLTLQLSFKGDIKRESAFLQQYGQSVATPIAAWLVAIAASDQFPLQLRAFTLIGLPVLMASGSCAVLKRIFGRMRPNRENAGKFTGFTHPTLKRDNKRESFPSSHSACAFALTMTLIHFWPEAAVVFWTLAGITAGLRYVLDAHFPSDIIFGSLLGVLLGHYGYLWLDAVLPRTF